MYLADYYRADGDVDVGSACLPALSCVADICGYEGVGKGKGFRAVRNLPVPFTIPFAGYVDRMG